MECVLLEAARADLEAGVGPVVRPVGTVLAKVVDGLGFVLAASAAVFVAGMPEGQAHAYR